MATLRLSLLAVFVLLVVVPGLATAAFPGENGDILFTQEGGLYRTENRPYPSFPDATEVDVGFDLDRPAFSPDGTRIATGASLSANSTLSSVWILGPAVGQARRLTDGDDSDPSWSPDGNELVFVREVSSGDELYAIGVEGGPVRRVTPPLFGRIDSPVWSPDGEWLAFTRIVEGPLDNSIETWLIRPDGSGARRVLHGLTAHSIDLDWHPARPELLLLGERDGDGTNGFEILRVDIVTGQVQEFPAFGVNDPYEAFWAPDGSAVLVAHQCEAELTCLRYVTVDGEASDRIRTGAIQGPEVFGLGWQPVAPLPHATSVEGAPVAGAPPPAVVVNGQGFVRRSIVHWNGSTRPTRFLSPGKLSVQPTPADVVDQGTAALTVATSPVGGGVSNALPIRILPPPPQPRLSLRGRFAVRWRESRTQGRVVVVGHAEIEGSIQLSLARGGLVLQTVVTRVNRGEFRRAFRLRASLLPGPYEVRGQGVGAPPAVALANASHTLNLASPREGVVSSGSISIAGYAGPPATRLSRTKVLYGQFRIANLPRRGGFHTRWYRNGRALTSGVGRPRLPLVRSRLISPRYLKKGRYECVLRASGVVVARVGIRVG